MRITKKKIVGTVAAASVVALGAGTAFAFWTTTGGGSGQATTGTDTPVTVVQTAVITGLGPGGPSQPLFGTFTNPNNFPVTISGLTGQVTAASAAGCNPADFTVTGTAVLPAGGVIAVDDTSTWSGLNIAMTETGSNQNACKAPNTLTITYTVT